MDFTGIGMMTRPEIEQDVGSMWESDASAEWERLNEITPDEERIMTAAREMEYALDHLSEAIDELATVAEMVDETVAYDRIVSQQDALEKLQDEIRTLKKRMERGGVE